MENESETETMPEESGKRKRPRKNYGLDVAYQCSYFNWYVRLPTIISVLILVAFFVWGIVDPCVYRGYVRKEYVYGIMGLSNGFLCWLVWMIIGAVSALISYLCNRIFMSQKVLTVLYLQKLCEKYSEADDNDENENEDEDEAEDDEKSKKRAKWRSKIENALKNAGL